MAEEGQATGEGAPQELSFEQRVVAQQRRLLRVAYLMLGHREDAEDATQRALLKALKAKDRFRGDSELYTWLYRILINQCKDRHKARSRSQRTFVELAPGIEATAASSASGVQERLERREQAERVRQAIGRLPSKLREILVLRHYQELAYDEMASLLGIPIGTVRSRLSKARDRLRQELVRQRADTESRRGDDG